METRREVFIGVVLRLEAFRLKSTPILRGFRAVGLVILRARSDLRPGRLFPTVCPAKRDLNKDLSLYRGLMGHLSLCQTDGVNGMTWVAHCGGSHTTGDLSLGGWIPQGPLPLSEEA